MNSAPTATQVVSAAMSRPDVERLRRLAVQGDRSFSAELRRAVRAHIEREAAVIESRR